MVAVNKINTIQLVPVDALKPGMWFAKLGGSGFHSVLVRRDFLLSESDIEAIKLAKISEVWIDTEKGLGLESKAVQAATIQPSSIAFGMSSTHLHEKRKEESRLDAGTTSKREPPPSTVVEKREPLISPVLVIPKKTELMHEEMNKAIQVCEESKEKVMELFADARLGKAIEAESIMHLVDSINESVSRHPDALLSVARLKTHDEYTYMHSVAVCGLMVALSRRLGLPDEMVQSAGAAGMLHDLGKAVMPLHVLNKPGALTEDEFKIMKAHPVKGFEMLKVSGVNKEEVMDVVLHHHEKFDGTGYPHKLAGDDISLMARMGAVCDVYDAITSNRPYKKAWGPGESLQKMFSWKGHFDETILKAFIRSVGIYPVGTLVRLESDRLGVITEQGMESLLTPKIKIFFNAKKREPIAIREIDLSRPECQDKIVGLESPERWNFPNLDRFWQI